MKQIEHKLAKAISGSKFENKTFLVGGYLRDQFMGRENKDIDLVVNRQNGGIELANFLYERQLCSKPVVFRTFGTAQVKMAGYELEFVMTREESYRDRDRKPAVRSANLKQDVKRRDFTINSLLKNITTGDVIDLTGKAQQDIEKKIIRTISNPDRVFKEDPLRMLRAVRFAVQLDFTIAEKTQKGIAKHAKTLQDISVERIRDELDKILLSPKPVKGIQLLVETGLMQQIIPELLTMRGVQQNKYHDKDVYEHTLLTLQETRRDLNLRLAALLHDIAKPITRSKNETGVHFYGHQKTGAKLARRILARLRYSGQTIETVAKLIRHHLAFKVFGENLQDLKDKHLRKFLFKLGKDAELLLELMHADNLAHAPEHAMSQQIPAIKKRLKKIHAEIKEKKLPISGKDVMLHFGIEQGKEIGKILETATEIWLEHPNWNKEKILNFISRGGQNERK